MCVQYSWRPQEGVGVLLGLELQTVVIHHVVLGIEPESLEKKPYLYQTEQKLHA